MKGKVRAHRWLIRWAMRAPTTICISAARRVLWLPPGGLRRKNWPEAQVHSEAFQPLKVAAATDGQDTFTVTLASSGETWPVPGDKTIAQVLQEHGVAVALSCEMGMCGACLTPLMAGEADHRDTVQSEAEKAAAAQQIALCCSRSRSANLLIDL
jgi:vanillate O-demethylase ferredoxin subunit